MLDVLGREVPSLQTDLLSFFLKPTDHVLFACGLGKASDSFSVRRCPRLMSSCPWQRASHLKTGSTVVEGFAAWRWFQSEVLRDVM